MENSHFQFLSAERSPRINVLNIETEPRKGEGDNWTNGKFGKLNQLKIHISIFLSTERSLHINVLNIETEPRMDDGENWIIWKFTSLVFWVQKGHHT